MMLIKCSSPSELNVSAVDKALSETVARNVAEALQLFCTKCQQLIDTSGDASQVIGWFIYGFIYVDLSFAGQGTCRFELQVALLICSFMFVI